jgi:hypothetical protein
MAQLERLRSLTPEDPLRRRDGGLFRLSVDEGEARVLLGLRELRMPEGCGPALRFVAEAPGTFRAADLPGLDADSRMVLAARLVREGAVEIVDAAG